MMTTLDGRLDDPDAWVTGIPDDLYAELDRLYGSVDTILVGRTLQDVVHPVVSAGSRWFDQIEEQRGMELLSATAYSNGVVGLYYEPKAG